jgi:hypothetical protein
MNTHHLQLDISARYSSKTKHASSQPRVCLPSGCEGTLLWCTGDCGYRIGVLFSTGDFDGRPLFLGTLASTSSAGGFNSRPLFFGATVGQSVFTAGDFDGRHLSCFSFGAMASVAGDFAGRPLFPSSRFFTSLYLTL